MLLSKEIRMKHFGANIPEYFFLRSTKALSDHSRKHEHLCGDLYVSYEVLGSNLQWEKPTDYEENLALGLFPDRQMVFNGKIVFWEVDRGTEDYVSPKGISGKVEKYIKLSAQHPDKRFSTVFTAVDAKQSAKTRVRSILDVLETYCRGDQFLATLHKWAVTEPLESVYMSPLDPQGIPLF